MVTHTRRSGGAEDADEGNPGESDMRRGGRWNRDKMESCYLSQLPKRLMRILADFPKEIYLERMWQFLKSFRRW